MASDNLRQLLTQFSNDGRAIVNRTLHDARVISVKENAREIWNEILRVLRQFNELSSKLTDPNLVKEHFRIILRNKILRTNLCFVLLGLSIGTSCGYMIGAWVARPYHPSPVMKAVACYTFDDTADSVVSTIVKVPALCTPTDLLIRVRASSIHRIDNRIVSGYGRNLRRMIQNYNTYDHQELPLVIGRSCAGVVEGVGRNATRGLDIGDEVWLASPWYEAGLSSQLVVAPELRVSRKPIIIGFEGAASLPYSGCIALSALERAFLNEQTAKGKRILVVDGCSPVGCVLTQILKKWGGLITATCSVRSVPVIKALGADDVIAFNNDDTIYEMEERDLFVKELLIRKPFDNVFLTTSSTYNRDFISKFVTNNGQVIDTVERRLSSDEYGFINRYLFSIYVKMRKLLACVFHTSNDWGEVHICHKTLDRLAEYVNDGILQTVVDQVYTADDADKALTHICSGEAIGGTIVTFRS